MRTVYYDMYQVAEHYHGLIKQTLDILDKGACACYEHSGHETVYNIQKRGKDLFAFQNAETAIIEEITANELLNRLFAHAPFIPMVGTSVGKTL